LGLKGYVVVVVVVVVSPHLNLGGLADLENTIGCPLASLHISILAAS